MSVAEVQRATVAAGVRRVTSAAKVRRATIRFQQTPYKWMVEVEKVLDISNTLLRELMSKWSLDNNAFRIHNNLVPFSLVDVCFGLVLWVVGEKVNLEEDRGGEVEHKVNLVVKKCNLELEEAGKERKLQLQEMEEIRLEAYEN
ncbi:hypothetical protein VNO80_31630 [Phaseolus coccineus]|uniref:Uncharacterized protein n=1 Tax=Phaseolus coccineus TaxID=3886 RepID=A0AAN9L420_PHACN